MSDPFSVAGSAVGVVSLGLDVLKGLTWYLGSIKSRKQEIKNSLKEAKTISSIHSSLGNILSSVDNDFIQECLEGSKLELQELHQFLEELKETSTSSTSSKGKIKDIGHSIIYPFRERKLNSLRQTLERLLEHLNLAITTTILRYAADNDRKTTTIETTMRDGFRIQDSGFRDISTQIQALPTPSIPSKQELYDMFSQLLDEKVSFAERSPKGNECGPVGLISSLRSSPSKSQEAVGLRLGTKAFTNRPRVVPLICDCPLASDAITYTNTFCGIRIRRYQRTTEKHRPGCTFYGIDRKIERTMEMQFSLKMKWLFASAIQTSIALAIGSNKPRISIRLKNFVPRKNSPFHRSVDALYKSIIFRPDPKPPEVLIQIFHDFRCEVFSLYRERKMSPNDRDEYGQNHLQILLDTVIATRVWITLAIDSIATVFIQLLCDLAKLVRVDGEKIKLRNFVFYLSIQRLDNWTYYQRMISSLATIMEIDSDLVLDTPCPEEFNILTLFPELIDAMDIHPIAGAILSRSLIDLKEIILRDPEAPMAIAFDLKTLQLCASWPEGLQALLETKAKSLMDRDGDSPYYQTPVMRAAWFNCAEAVDILMKADCQWDADMWIGPYFGARHLKNLSSEVVSVIASNLAERRRNLLRLAEQELRIPRHADPSYVPDCIAADLCRDLDLAGVSFHPCLRVSQSYKNIYHFPRYPIKVFPAFFKEGFQDCAVYDSTGLTPAMIWRHSNWEDQDTLSALLWMCEQGLLDQKAEDPLRLGLNVHATGWHSIASMFGATYIMSLDYYDTQPPMGWEIMKRFSRVEMRDECVCWCSIDGKGCSPLMSLWKAHADTRGMNLEYGGCYSLISRQIRHLLFHNDSIFSMRENGPSSLLLEFLRFITFEALDMKHTCCVLSRVDSSKRSCHIVPEDFNFSLSRGTIVLAHRDHKGAKRTRSDDLEQENAQTLELLMKDFTEKLKTMEPSPRALETFLWGYWRRRISELYSVKTELVNEMGRELRNVQTHILPERVSKFLGKYFGLLRYNTREASMGNDDDDDDASSIEDIDLPPHCPICDGRRQQQQRHRRRQRR